MLHWQQALYTIFIPLLPSSPPPLLPSFPPPLLLSLHVFAAAEKTETTEQLLAKPPSFLVRIDKRKTLGDLKEELEVLLHCEAKSFKVGYTEARSGTELHSAISPLSSILLSWTSL